MASLVRATASIYDVFVINLYFCDAGQVSHTSRALRHDSNMEGFVMSSASPAPTERVAPRTPQNYRRHPGMRITPSLMALRLGNTPRSFLAVRVFMLCVACLCVSTALSAEVLGRWHAKGRHGLARYWSRSLVSFPVFLPRRPRRLAQSRSPKASRALQDVARRSPGRVLTQRRSVIARSGTCAGSGCDSRLSSGPKIPSCRKRRRASDSSDPYRRSGDVRRQHQRRCLPQRQRN